jgi:hypothetical protein
MSLIRVRSCSAVLRMLLVSNLRSYHKISSDINFLFWIPIIWTSYIYVSKDVRIRGCFSRPKGVREQKSLGKTLIEESSGVGVFVRCTVFLFRTGHRPETKCPKAHTHCRWTCFVARVDRTLSCSSGAIGLRQALRVSFPYSVVNVFSR